MLFLLLKTSLMTMMMMMLLVSIMLNNKLSPMAAAVVAIGTAVVVVVFVVAVVLPAWSVTARRSRSRHRRQICLWARQSLNVLAHGVDLKTGNLPSLESRCQVAVDSAVDVERRKERI
ncbi:hypothetical protein B0F90DRAFT_1746589 [Multifurca ochricompacta]|uniref:Uncharacterized protein n=1 Tax=Multifurca ochricompacta TaxID=376703 RepID=A0AAD4QK50_9AGAM|nr:hypothetical protein B0F90DRAFT_1746589 [Multifurca ochricompacta]